MPFSATNKRSRFRCVPILLCMHSSYANAFYHCAYDGWVWGAHRILVNSTSGRSWPLEGIPTNCPYLPYNCAIMEVWLPFMACRICILRTLLSGWSFLFMIYEPLQYLQAWPTWLSWIPHPLLPWGDDDSHWSWCQYIIERHNIINGNRMKHQSLLLRGIGSGPGPLSPPSSFLGMVINKPNTCTLGLSWPTITKTDSRHHFHAYRSQLLCSKVFLWN